MKNIKMGWVEGWKSKCRWLKICLLGTHSENKWKVDLDI